MREFQERYAFQVGECGQGRMDWSAVEPGQTLRRRLSETLAQSRGAYTYARGASNGAKYGKVVRRRHRKITEPPVANRRRQNMDLSSYKAEILNKVEAIEEQIADLNEKKEKLNNLYTTVEALPSIDKI